MIIVRDVFQLKFGTAKTAVSVCREGLEQSKTLGFSVPTRLMTDLVGTYYTLVMESSYDSLAHFEHSIQEAFATEEWRAWYQKLLPCLESGRREIFTMVS